MKNWGTWWDGYETKLLWRLYKSGTSLTLIAEALGRSESAVVTRIRMIKAGMLLTALDNQTIKDIR